MRKVLPGAVWMCLSTACGSGVPPGIAASGKEPAEQQVMAAEPTPSTPQVGRGPTSSYLELQQALAGSASADTVLGFFALTRRHDLDAQAARGGDVLVTLRATRVQAPRVATERVEGDKAHLEVSGSQLNPATNGWAPITGTVEMAREGDTWRVVRETYQAPGTRPASSAPAPDPSPRTGP
ncbi:MAG: hypothetical protein WKG00_23570 [Polyangiaceae bacterium]